MNNNYKVLGKFECCGKTLFNVIVNGNICTMSQGEYNKLMKDRRLEREKDK